MIEMLRKINTSRAVRTMQELFPEEYDFYPRSWILPEEYQLFCAQVGPHRGADGGGTLAAAHRGKKGHFQPSNGSVRISR